MESGNHQLCIDNYSSQEVILNFEFLSGVTARDYSDLVKRDNLQPIELNLQKLEDMMGYLIHEFESIMRIEKKTVSMSDYISYKIIIFTIFTLVVTALASFLEVVYVKKFLINRKLI